MTRKVQLELGRLAARVRRILAGPIPPALTTNPSVKVKPFFNTALNFAHIFT